MSDERIVQQINESRSEQALREHIASGQSVESFEDKATVEKYNNMDESQKAQFTQKGWKNG